MNNKSSTKKDILLEKDRAWLLTKARQSKTYKTRPNETRYTRRTKVKVANKVSDYNNIQMDALFKEDMLEFVVKVQGETDNYEVIVFFEHILDRIKKYVVKNGNKLAYKCVLQALVDAFDSEDLYVSCSCPDFIYGGYNYYAWNQDYSSKLYTGKANQPPVIRNPKDDKGSACKHILMVLSNRKWLMKVASVIHNYIWYAKDHMSYNYKRYIEPKIYDTNKEIEKETNEPKMSTDTSTIDTSNEIGRTRGQFKKQLVPNNANINNTTTQNNN